MNARIYRAGRQLLQGVTGNPQINRLAQTVVLGISRADDGLFSLALNGGKGLYRLQARSVVIATGCYDMPVIFPGWTLPGVMSAGGIQTFVKSQQLVPGERFLFAGSHPLQLVVADQIVRAGGKVAGVMFAQKFSRVLQVLRFPSVMIRHADKLLFIAGILRRLRRAGVPVRFAETLLQANGDDALQSVDIAPLAADGSIDRDKASKIECDRLGVCFSFLASTELARQCGAESIWSADGGGWVIRCNEWMGSSVPGLYVAGEVTGVAGADVAAEEGRLAGLGVLIHLAVMDGARASRLSVPIRRRLQHLHRFADLLRTLSFPGGDLLQQLCTDEAVLCKCEGLTAGEFRKQLADNPFLTTANSAKLFSRAGMGLCQGRYCNYPVTRILAGYAGSEAAAGPFTARFPAKPVRIRDLLSGPT